MRKKNEVTTKKLSVRREQIRKLTANELSLAWGGVLGDSNTTSLESGDPGHQTLTCMGGCRFPTLSVQC